MSFKAVYARYFVKEYEEFETLDEAITFLVHGSDHGDLFQICIVGPDGTVYKQDRPTFDLSDDIPAILQKLEIPFTEQSSTFVMA
jgi:hypothetical protein